MNPGRLPHRWLIHQSGAARAHCRADRAPPRSPRWPVRRRSVGQIRSKLVEASDAIGVVLESCRAGSEQPSCTGVRLALAGDGADHVCHCVATLGNAELFAQFERAGPQCLEPPFGPTLSCEHHPVLEFVARERSRWPSGSAP